MSRSRTRSIPCLVLLCTLCLIALALAAPADASTPCCTVVSIDAKTGVATAQDHATSKTFQFQVKDPALLRTLKVGQPVFYADHARTQISVNGVAPCCSIIQSGLKNLSQEVPKLPKLGQPPSQATLPATSPNPIPGQPGGGFQQDTPLPNTPLPLPQGGVNSRDGGFSSGTDSGFSQPPEPGNKPTVDLNDIKRKIPAPGDTTPPQGGAIGSFPQGGTGPVQGDRPWYEKLGTP